MAVRNNTAARRYELEIDDSVAKAFYREQGNVVTFVHTEVPPALGGRGVGTELMKGALAAVRAAKKKVKIVCPFFAAFLRKHPEDYADLLAEPLPPPPEHHHKDKE